MRYRTAMEESTESLKRQLLAARENVQRQIDKLRAPTDPLAGVERAPFGAGDVGFDKDLIAKLTKTLREIDEKSGRVGGQAVGLTGPNGGKLVPRPKAGGSFLMFPRPLAALGMTRGAFPQFRQHWNEPDVSPPAPAACLAIGACLAGRLAWGATAGRGPRHLRPCGHRRSGR